MSSLSRYALWLAPDDVGTAQLQAVIHQLAERYGGPVFAPHVTLLGRIHGDEDELATRLDSLASGIPPIQAALTGYAGKPYYFECFFSPVENSAELGQLVEQASTTFGSDADPNFEPHVSLLYGQLDRAQKKTIPEQIGDKVPRQLLLNRLQLVRMTVSVSGWEVLAEATLTG